MFASCSLADSQVVYARNREVQIYQSDIRHSPLYRNNAGGDHERAFKSCKTLAEYRTKKKRDPLGCFAEF